MVRAFQKLSMLPLLGVVFVGALIGFAQEEKPAPAKPPHHIVTSGPFKISIEFDGVFEARETTELSIQPREWTQFVVQRAVAQGTRVKEGDLLVWLDTRKIDEQIQELQAARELSLLAIQQGEEQLRHLEMSIPLDLAAAERSKRIADEDLARFLEVDRELEKKQAEFSLKSSAMYLEYAQEELNQLEKMYKADDLTEETEEIILKRARYSVENSRFAYESQKISTDQTLNIFLPRQEVSLKTAAQRQAIQLQNAQNDLPLKLKQSREELAKRKRDQEIADQRLEKLQADLAAMAVKAPTDGIVYYGQSVHGSWDTAKAAEQMLQPGGQLAPHKVFITLVKPRPLSIRVEVPEKHLHYARPGTAGKTVPVAYPHIKLAGEFAEVSSIPDADGKFRATFKPALAVPESVVPGMTCKVTIVPYAKPDTITVPVKTVFEDELDDERRFVYLLNADGQSVRHEVVIGNKTDDRIEIVRGLQDGDEILLEKPADGAAK